jgi:Uma2 family endonuclease
MLAQSLHRFTVAEYYRMAETGLLRPDARVELLDGKIIDMPPIGSFHGGSVNRLVELFVKMSDDRWQVSAQNPIRLSNYSEPQPDLALLKRSPDFYAKRHPGPEDVFLVIEVADSSLSTDRNDKLPAYGNSGVPELWIVNLQDKVVEVCREPHYTGYASRQVFRAGQTVSPQAFSDAVIDVSALMLAAG